MSKKRTRPDRNADKRLPLGVERMLPLAAAVFRAEGVLTRQGEALANGRSEGYQRAYGQFKAALDAVQIRWNDCRDSMERNPVFSLGEINELHDAFNQFYEDITETARNWRDYAVYSRSARDRIRRFFHLAQQLERRLNALSGVPLDSLDGDGDGGPKQPPTWERITLTPETAGGGRVQLDNHTARIASQVRYDMVTLLVKAKGDTVLAVSMKDERISKPKREYDALPKWLRAVILPPKKNGGRGYRMLP